MAHDVFISYPSKDKHAAYAACSVLEHNGIRCWIAPRDVVPGMVWGSVIVGAIHTAKMMVLVFSGAANTSPQIEREVERAISKGIPVIPFRVEDVQPSDSLEYFISASHWLDAFTPPLEQHLDTLAKVVRRILEVKGETQSGRNGSADRQTADVAAIVRSAAAPLVGPPVTVPVSTAATASGRTRRWPLAVGVSAAIAACAAFAVLYIVPELRRITPASLRQVGEVFRDYPACPQMVVVPAGRFSMSAAEHEKSDFDWAQPAEGPVHEVRIVKPFAVGVFAVTRDEFEEFVQQTGNPVGGGCNYWDDKEVLDPTRSFRDPKLSGGPQEGDHPVVCVSPQEANKFTVWLSGKTGRNYRLLSDAEREYVARAGTTSAFWWGARISPDQANYWSDAPYRGNATRPARWTTVPVKFFQPNPWGLYQVHGNVAEWVADCWHPTYEGSPSEGSVWQIEAGNDCKEHTIRGGTFFNNADLLRSSHRRAAPDLREIGFGFRVAQTLIK